MGKCDCLSLVVLFLSKTCMAHQFCCLGSLCNLFVLCLSYWCVSLFVVSVLYGANRFDKCEFHLEKLTFEKAAARCAGFIDDTTQSNPVGEYEMGRFHAWFGGTQATPNRVMEICQKKTNQTAFPNNIKNRQGVRVLGGCGYGYRESWMNEPCTIQVQVDQFGRLNAVHVGTSEAGLKLDSGNVFHVHWKDDLFPLAAEDDCGGE